jgi:hypothetical protein
VSGSTASWATRGPGRWRTDPRRFHTEQEGWRWFFGAIDRGIDEVLGRHVAQLEDRWAALEPIHLGVRHAFAMLDARRSLNVEG